MEFTLIKSGIPYADIKIMSEKEVFEFMILISELNNYEKEKLEASMPQGI